MAEKEVVVREVQWSSVFSIVHLMRSFRIALWPPSKLLLCLAAIVITVGAGILLDQAFETRVYGHSFWQNMIYVYRAAAGATIDANETDLFVSPPQDLFALDSVVGLRGFWYGPLEAARHMARLVAAYWRTAPWFALLNTLIALLVWTFFGGAVCRIAAVQFARDDRPGIGAALKFACKRYASLLASPLALFIVVALLALVAFLPASLVLWIPYVGEIVFAVFFFLVILLGLVLAMLVVFGVSSLGLQMPAIGAEGRDAFDAVSRAVNYVFTRPWRYILYTVFSLLYLCFSFVAVRALVFLALKIPHVAMSIWPWDAPEAAGAGEVIPKLQRVWVAPTLHQLFQMPQGARGTEYVAAILITVLVLFLLGLMIAFLPSFFLSSQTIIYFLLRRKVDFKDLDEVCLEEEAEEAGAPPLEKKEETAVEAEPPVAGSAAPPAQPTQPEEDDLSDDG